MMDTNPRISRRSHEPRSRDDCAFLPAALEILDTPASPIRIAFIWFICTLSMAALLWTWLGRIDVVATAQGKVQPAGRVKIIQSLDTGKIISAPLQNGVHVEAGEKLLQLDDTQVRAELSAVEAHLTAWQAEAIRRRTINAVANRWSLGNIKNIRLDDNTLTASFPENLSAAIREREIMSFRADLTALISTLKALDAQRTRHVAEIERLTQTVSARQALVTTLSERVGMRSTLAKGDAGTRASVIDALEVQQKEAAELVAEQGLLKETEAAIATIEQEARKHVDTVLADNAARLSDALRQIDAETQAAVKARRQLELLTIVSPVTGTIQASAITTPGQVVTVGAELMRVVPDGSTLEIEAYLPNRDIGFVRPGQEAAIKVEAFPFTRYGVLHGKVSHVARDAIPEPDAQQSEQQVTTELHSIVPVSNAQRVQNLVFPITVSPASSEIVVDGHNVPLRPGMAVTIEIKTGRRRILEYLFSPLAEITDEAMHER